MSDEEELQSPHEPDDPREWLRLAREDLTAAGTEIPGVGFELRAYHAQQAAEKALKAVCIARGIEFPFTHQIEWLLEVLRRDGVGVAGMMDAHRLTRFATDTRYPQRTQLAAGAFAELLVLARNVMDWAVAEVSKTAWRVKERRPHTYENPQPGTSRPDPALLDELVARIVEAAAPERIILFGSAARGTMGPHSDLDLLIVTEREDHSGELDAAVRTAIAAVAMNIDIVFTTPADVERYGHSIGLVYRPALKDGRELYRRPPAPPHC